MCLNMIFFPSIQKQESNCYLFWVLDFYHMLWKLFGQKNSFQMKCSSIGSPQPPPMRTEISRKKKNKIRSFKMKLSTWVVFFFGKVILDKFDLVIR